MCYKYSGKEEFLSQAVKIGNFLLKHPTLREDKIPFWDLCDPAIPDAEKDASSATIMASALLQMYEITRKDLYLKTAENILSQLSEDRYFPGDGIQKGFIIAHNVGNYPQNSEIDVPLIYADYYYIESLLKLRNIYEDRTKKRDENK